MGKHIKTFFKYIIIANSLVVCASLVMEHLVGLAPCVLCIDQRRAYIAVLILAIIGFNVRHLHKLALIFVIIGYVVTGFLAFHQVLVEEHIIAPSGACQGVSIESDDDIETYSKKLMSAPTAPCDAPPYRILGMSIAGYSAAFSCAMFIYSLAVGLGVISRIKIGD